MNHRPQKSQAGSRWLIVLLAALVLAAAVPAAAEAPVIQLPADPPASRTVDLQEMWRIGGEDDEDILLGVIGRGVIDEQGQVYLLDRQLSQVLVIGPDGELVTTLGREGDGPGEMRRPGDLFLMADGQVGVTQGFPGKIVIINADDTPGGSISIGESSETGGFFFMGRAIMRGGNLLLHSGRGTFDMATSKSTTVQSLALVDLEGQELVRFVEHTQERDISRQEFNEEKNFSELDTWAVGDGVVYTVPVRDEYLIRKRDLQGGEVATFVREFTTREREQEDKDDLTSGMRIIINGVNQEIDKHVLDNDPALMNISVTPDGRLFVTTCWGQRKLLPDGVAARVDVIGDDGSFIEELTLTVPEFNRKQDRLMFLDGKHWLLIRNFDSASESMNAGFGGGDEEDEEDLGDIEPLEVVLYVMPD